MDAVLCRIRSLAPVRDDAEICRLSLGYHFAEEFPMALRFALLRTFCVPEIAALLDQTGVMYRQPQRRHDDTVLLLAELIEHGLDSARGRRAMARMNAIHARYDIPNDQYLYVLSVFVLEPIRWVERCGWGPASRTRWRARRRPGSRRRWERWCPRCFAPCSTRPLARPSAGPRPTPSWTTSPTARSGWRRASRRRSRRGGGPAAHRVDLESVELASRDLDLAVANDFHLVAGVAGDA